MAEALYEIVTLVTAVGDDDYASHLAKEAKEFVLTKGELRTSIDLIPRIVTWLLVPTAALLLWSQLQSEQSIPDGLVGAAASVVAMVPQGLVLLVSVSLAVAVAVAVVRFAKQQTLVQELPAVETLARVDTHSVDKTGTLTSGVIVFDQVLDVGSSDAGAAAVLGSIGAADPGSNATMVALGEAFSGAQRLEVASRVPFSDLTELLDTVRGCGYDHGP